MADYAITKQPEPIHAYYSPCKFRNLIWIAVAFLCINNVKKP